MDEEELAMMLAAQIPILVQSDEEDDHHTLFIDDTNAPFSISGRAFFSQLDELRMEVQRRDQEILAMAAKMKTLEEQHQDYQRHIAVLKESLCAKEEHYNMLQADVSIRLRH